MGAILKSHTQSKSTVHTHTKPTVPRASPKAHKSNFPKVSLLEDRDDFAHYFSRYGIANIAAMYNAQTSKTDFRYRNLGSGIKSLIPIQQENYLRVAKYL